MPLRVVIADDEPGARELLRDYLSRESEIEIVAECADGKSALAAIRKMAPDLVFLDIQMPELNGLEVIRQLSPANIPVVIFVTAYNQYAIEAFNVSAADYLLKPFDQSRFQKALWTGREKVIQRKRNSEVVKWASETEGVAKDRIAVRSSGKIILIEFRLIDWIKGAGNYAELHVGEEVHLLRQTLNSLQQKLPEEFARISRTHIVNMTSIRELKAKSHGDCTITLLDGTELIVTRKRRLALRSKLDL